MVAGLPNGEKIWSSPIHRRPSSSSCWAHVADFVKVVEYPMGVESHQATQKGQGVITAHPVPSV